MSKKKSKSLAVKSKICPVCKERFSYTPRSGEPIKYCSTRCRNLANRRKSQGKPVDYVAPIGQTKTCPVCGRKFVNTHVGQEMCSSKCRAYATNAKKVLKYWKVPVKGLSISELVAKYREGKADRNRQRQAKIEERIRKREEADRLHADSHVHLSGKRTLSIKEIEEKRRAFSSKREAIAAKKEAEKIARRDQDRKNKEIIADRAERLGLKTIKVKCSRCGHEFRYVVTPFDTNTCGGISKNLFCSDYCRHKTKLIKYKMECEKYGKKLYKYGNYRPNRTQEKITLVTRNRGTGFYAQARPTAVRVAKEDVDKFLTGNWNIEVEDVSFSPAASINDLIPQNMEDFS